MGSTRIKGRKLKLTIGSPGTDYYADVTRCEINNEEADADVVTFEDAAQAGGARRYVLDIAAVQSTDTESLWSYIWEHAGEEVAFTYAPHGNAVATAAQPHVMGTVIVGPRPKLGGEAGHETTYTFETQWEIVGEPVLDRGGED